MRDQSASAPAPARLAAMMDKRKVILVALAVLAGALALRLVNCNRGMWGDEMCLLVCGGWGAGAAAGAGHVYWYNARSGSGSYVGFRLACYPV